MAERVLFAAKQGATSRGKNGVGDASAIDFLTGAREVLVKQKNVASLTLNSTGSKASEIMLQASMNGELMMELPDDPDEEARAERLGISKVSEPGSVAGSVPCQAPDLDLVNHAAIVPPQPRVSKAGAKRGRRASLIAASDLEIQQLALQGMQGHQKSGKLLPQLTTSSTGSTPRDNSQSGKRFGFMHGMPRAIGGYNEEVDATDPQAIAQKLLEQSDLTFLAVREPSRAGKELETLRRRIEGRKEMLHVAADACIEAHSLSQDGSSSEDDERRVSKSGPSAFLPLLPGSSVMHQASQDLPTSPVVANVSPSGKAAPSGFVVPKLDLKSVSPGGHTNTSTAGNTPSSREAAGSSLAAGTPHDTRRANSVAMGTPRSRAGLPTASNITPRLNVRASFHIPASTSAISSPSAGPISPGGEGDATFARISDVQPPRGNTPRGGGGGAGGPGTLPSLGRVNTGGGSKLAHGQPAGTPRGGMAATSTLAQAMAHATVSNTPRGILGRLKDIFQTKR